MKRLILLLLAYAVGGAIINVAVAWGCALMLAEKSDGWSSMRSGALRFENGNTWGAWRLDRPGYFKIESHVSLPISDWDDRWEPPRSLIEAWGHVPSPEELGTQWIEEGSGWPCVWLWSRTTFRDPLHNYVGFDARVLPRDSVEGGFVVWQSVLPVNPLWPGFAINTIFYAAILWPLFATAGFVRRRIRATRGQCTRCGYPVGTSDVCTECGKPVKAKAVLPT